MESIINHTGNHQKLVLPTPGQLYPCGKLRITEKEFFLLPLLRLLVGKLLRQL